MRWSGYVIINSRQQFLLMRKLGMIVRVISLPADDSHEITCSKIVNKTIRCTATNRYIFFKNLIEQSVLSKQWRG